MPDQPYLPSRRTTLHLGIAILAGSTAAPAMAKATQKGVQYVAESKKPNQSCANCKNLLPPNMCNLVDGEVVPAGWCLIWAAKKA